MQRYFVRPDRIREDQVEFHSEDIHHIRNVMRMAPGDQVWASDGTGRDYRVELVLVQSDRVMGRILEIVEETRELPVRVTLAQGVAKGDKMDWIVQKATEMGAVEILPFTSSRTVVKLDEKKARSRVERWQRIAKEAAEQSHRSLVPRVADLITFPELAGRAAGYDLALIAYEQEKEIGLPDLLEEVQANGTILIIIGPEGGFAEAEAELARQSGIRSISLGKRILRTETAGIAALAYCAYHFEQLRKS